MTCNENITRCNVLFTFIITSIAYTLLAGVVVVLSSGCELVPRQGVAQSISQSRTTAIVRAAQTVAPAVVTNLGAEARARPAAELLRRLLPPLPRNPGTRLRVHHQREGNGPHQSPRRRRCDRDPRHPPRWARLQRPPGRLRSRHRHRRPLSRKRLRPPRRPPRHGVGPDDRRVDRRLHQSGQLGRPPRERPRRGHRHQRLDPVALGRKRGPGLRHPDRPRAQDRIRPGASRGGAPRLARA